MINCQYKKNSTHHDEKRVKLQNVLLLCPYKIVPWQGAQLYDLKNGAEFSSDVFYALPRPSPWIEENS